MYDLVYYVFSKDEIYYIIIVVNRMKKIDNKGFTLVELIATIVLLSLVMGIGAYAITHIINNAKQKDYDLLIENINSAVELYYQECVYAKNGYISCPAKDGEGYYYDVKLGDLVKYGFLKGNSKITEGSDKDMMTLVNPKSDEKIASCKIRYKYQDGKIEIKADSSSSGCPTDSDYAG